MSDYGSNPCSCQWGKQAAKESTRQGNRHQPFDKVQYENQNAQQSGTGHLQAVQCSNVPTSRVPNVESRFPFDKQVRGRQGAQAISQECREEKLVRFDDAFRQRALSVQSLKKLTKIHRESQGTCGGVDAHAHPVLSQFDSVFVKLGYVFLATSAHPTILTIKNGTSRPQQQKRFRMRTSLDQRTGPRLFVCVIK